MESAPSEPLPHEHATRPSAQAVSAQAASTQNACYLIGHPVSQSLSPALYTAAFAALGLDWTYETIDIQTPEEAGLFVASREYRAVNITTPYKKDVLPFCQHTSATVNAVGGANLALLESGSLCLDNTDGWGFWFGLHMQGIAMAGRRLVVCGTGPTALSIVRQAALSGAGSVVLLSRDVSRAAAALSCAVEGLKRVEICTLDGVQTCTLGELGGCESGTAAAAVAAAGAAAAAVAAGESRAAIALKKRRCIVCAGDYEMGRDAIATADIVVNATTLGMHEGDLAPVDVELLHANQVLFDAPYGRQTALAHRSKVCGARYVSGECMLIGQAVANLSRMLDAARISYGQTAEELYNLMEQAVLGKDEVSG